MENGVTMDLELIGKRARQAARELALTSSKSREKALEIIADQIGQASTSILEENAADVADATSHSLSLAMVDRLLLNEARLRGITDDLRTVAQLPDPVGEEIENSVLPNQLRVRKLRVPLGVLGVIYEARPNVTVDIAGLALKSGNSAILRGGSETLRSNRALVKVVRAGLRLGGLPEDAIQFIDDSDRGLVLGLLQLDQYVDLIIPRGGAGLHDFCRKNSRIPVITGGIGICHLFVDQTANLEASLPVIENAKIQRPTVCNALDTVLVHEKVASAFIPALLERLSRLGVTFRLDPQAFRLCAGGFADSVQEAGARDFDTEWLSLVLGIQVVSGLDEAIAHISQHSTGHSDGILTENQANAERFLAEVDSAAVYWNASTRFTDGAQLGLGAEVAISTQRVHARGPMGLRELTTYKWVIEGNYTVRS
jgi:glutamate-5-semialdehyde dehydrogenase